MFTATMPGTIKQLVQNYLSKNAATIEADMTTVGHQGHNTSVFCSRAYRKTRYFTTFFIC